MKLASVILDISTQALETPYTYRVPEGGVLTERAAVGLSAIEQRMAAQFSGETSHAVVVGSSVVVPFGNRPAVGFVVEIAEVSVTSGGVVVQPQGPFDGAEVAKLKYLICSVSEPYFTEVGAACAQFLADRYVAPPAACLRLFMPPAGQVRMQRINNEWQLTYPQVKAVDERWVCLTPKAKQFTPRKGAVKQELVLAALQEGELRVAELRAEYGSVASTLKSLEAKGVVRIETRRRNRGEPGVSAAFGGTSDKPTLTHGQQQALQAIEQAAAHNDGHVVVVDGVTGSGKTEVYLQAIEPVLAAGKNAIVLVPEISLTPQTVARFRGRFGNTVAVLHSRMSAGERFDQWDAIRVGNARVVVGARSALFAPLRNVGIIVVDEEHESSYKQDQAPRYVTRDVAWWLARKHGAVLVLGSATPSLEALHYCETQSQWQRVLMPTRANDKPLPTIEVVDMAREFGGGNRSMFSRNLQQALFDVLDKGEKAVLMLNQRGFAQFLLCRDCGFVPECPQCSTSLTYHEQEARLMCHHCGFKQQVPTVCPTCGSPYLKRFGAGTQRVEAELRAVLADHAASADKGAALGATVVPASTAAYTAMEMAGTAAPAPPVGTDASVTPAEASASKAAGMPRIIRMDADTTKRKGAHQRLLEEFAAPGAAVLLGTQMIAKGLDFDEVTLVGVINADTMLHLPDFRASERTFNLIEQVAGRCGRGQKSGRVLVQTYSASNSAIRTAAQYNREAFLEQELALREGLGYPPFVRLANVLLWGKNKTRVEEEAQVVYEALRAVVPASDDWLLLPPCPCVLERLRGAWRYSIIIKAPVQASISQYVAPYFRTRIPARDVRVSLDIDPVSLL